MGDDATRDADHGAGHDHAGQPGEADATTATSDIHGTVAAPLRAYLRTLSPESRRQLLDTLEEAVMRGDSVITGGASEITVASFLGDLERSDLHLAYPPLWRGVCFPSEHALTDAWDQLSRWDIPRVALGALYTYVRLQLPEWAMLLQGFHTAPSGRARYLVLCAAMSLVGPFLTENADDAVLVDALRRRTRLAEDEVVRAVRLFARLVTIGPGFLDSVGEAFGLPVEELTVLPLLPAELRRPFHFDQAAVRQVASRYAQMPSATENQNQLVATQTALLLRNPSEVLNLIPASIRRSEEALAGSGFAAICEFVVSRLERHAREVRFFVSLWAEYGIEDPEYLPHAMNVTEIVEQHDRENLALLRLVRLDLRSPWGMRVRQAEKDLLDCLIHSALPLCWTGVRTASVYTLTPMDKPRPLPGDHQLENEKRLFRFIHVITPIIDRSNNRLALDSLRGTLSGVISALVASLKPSWFLSYRKDRDASVAMAGHVLCLLGNLERVGDVRLLAQRLNQQRIPLQEALKCEGKCRRPCGEVVMHTRFGSS